MIQSLRRRHFSLIVLLAIALVVIFIAGIIVRKPAPTNPQFPSSLLPASTGGAR